MDIKKYQYKIIANNLDKSINWISKKLELSWQIVKKIKYDILNKNVVISHKNKENEFTRKISIEDVDELIIKYYELIQK
ncbi:hypothetical protein [Mycoplasmopsis lipofaciens]|uniref:hypothetical protein n=1 Tax=Mycoplasmopsis lipofaciens TaxID=114884 RepID=UPI00048908BB|nr:hypothetical protein [Mycoplasmopsis lipofaciens]